MQRLKKFSILLLVVAALTGCGTDAEITSTLPPIDEVIYLNAGDTQTFTVQGSFADEDNDDKKCFWYVKPYGSATVLISNHSKAFEYVASENQESNNFLISCELKEYRQRVINTAPNQPSWDWFTIDQREWVVKIIPPVGSTWGGDYIIQNEMDIQLLQDSSIESISGLLSIQNSTLTNVNGLGGLASVGGKLLIANNDSLTNIDGLGSLTYLSGDLVINDGDTLVDLEGLNSLVSIGGRIHIARIPRLTTMQGLRNLTVIGGGLLVSSMDSLATLGLDSLNSVGHVAGIGVTNNFHFSENPELCTSLAEDLKNQVEAGDGVGGDIHIINNKDCSLP